MPPGKALNDTYKRPGCLNFRQVKRGKGVSNSAFALFFLFDAGCVKNDLDKRWGPPFDNARNSRMKITCNWSEKMKFEMVNGTGQSIVVDAKPPLGTAAGPTPKELALMGVAGCTGIDVIAYLRKYKQEVTAFSIDAEAPVSEVHPAVFLDVMLVFKVTGVGVEATKLLEAVQLSQTKYCGVSAMMSKAAPIAYRVELNGEVIGTGKAEF